MLQMLPTTAISSLLSNIYIVLAASELKRMVCVAPKRTVQLKYDYGR